MTLYVVHIIGVKLIISIEKFSIFLYITPNKVFLNLHYFKERFVCLLYILSGQVISFRGPSFKFFLNSSIHLSRFMQGVN